MLKPSTIYNAGLGSIAITTFSWYCDALVYIFLAGMLKISNTYGDGYMSITVCDFDNWYMKLEPKDTHINGNENCICVFKVSLCGCDL